MGEAFALANKGRLTLRLNQRLTVCRRACCEEQSGPNSCRDGSQSHDCWALGTLVDYVIVQGVLIRVWGAAGDDFVEISRLGSVVRGACLEVASADETYK